MINFFRCLLVVLLVVMAGCGGGTRSSTRLVSITVQAASPIVPLGGTAALTAVGTYSEGVTAVVTSAVLWSSSNPAVATVSSAGVVTTVTAGTTTITASSGTISATYVLTVVPLGGSVQGAPLSLSGTVTSLAGSAGTPGAVNGSGSGASFNLPVGMVTDGLRLYVADSQNNLIRVIEISSGAVTTLAGSGQQASSDGTGTAATFFHPEGITCDGVFLYVTERQSGKIRRIDKQTGVVTTFAAMTAPTGITSDGVDLFVTDAVDHVVRRISIASGTATLLAGSVGSPGSTNATGSGASFNQPVGITTDGTSLFVNDFGNDLVRRITIASGAVTTFASGFSSPANGITTDGTYLYVADFGNLIRRIPLSGGAVTTLVAAAAGLNHPEGLASDGHALFVADRDSHVIRRVN